MKKNVTDFKEKTEFSNTFFVQQSSLIDNKRKLLNQRIST